MTNEDLRRFYLFKMYPLFLASSHHTTPLSHVTAVRLPRFMFHFVLSLQPYRLAKHLIESADCFPIESPFREKQQTTARENSHYSQQKTSLRAPQRAQSLPPNWLLNNSSESEQRERYLHPLNINYHQTRGDTISSPSGQSAPGRAASRLVTF